VIDICRLLSYCRIRCVVLFHWNCAIAPRPVANLSMPVSTLFTIIGRR